MKINGAGGLFYGYRAVGPGQKKAGGSPLSAGGAKGDQVTLSKQIFSAIQMQNKIREMEKAEGSANGSPEAQTLDSMRKAMEVLKACRKIAARIRAGDNVPLKDMRYLVKHDPLAYQMAMAARKPKEDPKEWKSAVPKEEQENQQAVGASAGQPDGIQASSGCGTSSEGGSSGGTGEGSGGGQS